jgi:hypothetical protein
MLLSSLLVSSYVSYPCCRDVTTDDQITLPTRAYSLKRTGGPKPAAEEPMDEKMADGNDDDAPDSPVAATLEEQSPRGRQAVSASAGRDTSTPSDRTVIDTNVDRSKPS